MRCIYMQYISVAKVNFFYYNQTFWSYGNIRSEEREEKGDLVAQKLTPLYTCLFFTLPIPHPPNTLPISKGNS